MGALEILNVGAGDVKITYNTQDAAEAIRARRIVTDMLRRGYALLIEVDGKIQRVKEFDEARGEYLIADLDPIRAEETMGDPENKPGVDPELCSCGRPARHRGACKGVKRGARRRVPMSQTRATAVAPSAGG